MLQSVQACAIVVRERCVLVKQVLSGEEQGPLSSSRLVFASGLKEVYVSAGLADMSVVAFLAS